MTLIPQHLLSPHVFVHLTPATACRLYKIVY